MASSEMIMAMARPRRVCCLLILHLMVIATAQYNDDSDYDLVLYDDFSLYYGQNIGEEAPEYDDFYILAELEEPETSNSVIADQRGPSVFSHRGKAYEEKEANSGLLDRYEAPEKAYRYTKHRIPGYDYEELDYLGARSFRRCDEKSIWTHCLCQFTCTDPDVVDCYTPCKSGCECKEDYVFDEKSQTCLLPEECPVHSSKKNFLYKG